MASLPIKLDLFILLMFACYGSGTLWPILASVLPASKKILSIPSLLLGLAGSLVTIACAVWSWLSPLPLHSTPVTITSLPEPLPQIEFSFYADHMAGFFLLLTGVFALAVVLHLANWLEGIEDQHRIAASYNLFVLSITLTILADNAYSFLLFQELMTLAFAYLALFRHNTYVGKANVKAQDLEASKTAFKSYLIFEHVGSVLITTALIVLSIQAAQGAPGSASFETFRQLKTAKPYPPAIANLVFLISLAGFGIKAGVFPAHVWVPMVHPYSPTSIHAMMSGIALKVAGLYGMYRVFFFFLSPVQWWWGWLILLLAGATTLFGVFYALLGKDLKIALASHSVENIGIILAGIGLALIFHSQLSLRPPNSGGLQGGELTALKSSFEYLARLSLIASLYHLVNHSIFKGLLFFSTGAIENRTGVVALDKLGGLMQRYPLTSSAFLIGAVSIAGFPPFNGFVSEWLLLQSLFSGMNLFLTSQRIYLLLGLVALMVCLVLAFALTAMAFVKICGEVILGAPRDPEIAKKSQPGEVGWHIRVVLVGFAALCLLLGIFPAPITRALNRLTLEAIPLQNELNALQQPGSIEVQVPLVFFGPNQANPTSASGSEPASTAYQTRLSNRIILAIFLIVLGSVIAGIWLRRALAARKQAAHLVPPWLGGVPYDSTRMQYTGAAFASLIWKPFESKARSRTPGSPAAVDGRNGKFLPFQETVKQGRSVAEFTRLVYDYLIERLLALCETIGLKVQPGDIRVYLQYIFMLFIVILLFLLLTVGR